MIPVNRTYAPIQAFVDELARCGLEHAVTCPGSRNAPLLLALAGDERIACHSVIDERSAGFVALGAAKASGRPAAIAVTSGTAAANLLPAVVEAHEARVPLVVMTADRPPELREVGAGQSIDQIKLFGTAAKWFVEVGSHEPGRDTAVHHRALGCRAYHTAAGGRPGPVHLNFPLREPLGPLAEPLDPGDWRGRPDGRPWTTVHDEPPSPRSSSIAELAARISSAARGAIVCGPSAEPLGPPAARLAAATGWPLLAEPTSGARCGPHDRSHVVAHYDALLRSQRFAERHRPQAVVRLGDTPTSKPLRAWLAGTTQVVVDPHGAWHEPTRSAELILRASAGTTCEALAAELEARIAGDESWLAAWRAADALVPPLLDSVPDPFEPKAYAALEPALPDRSTIWVSSSMPVRDIETFFPQTGKELRFLANRGANGIDGVVSSALGAAVTSGGRAWLATGDLALVHDLGGLVASGRLEAELTILCVNNGGGGIFDFLPVAAQADAAVFERHIATPSGIEPARVAALAGLNHAVARTPAEIGAAVARPGLVEVPTDRGDSVRLHRELFERLDGALAGAAA